MTSGAGGFAPSMIRRRLYLALALVLASASGCSASPPATAPPATAPSAAPSANASALPDGLYAVSGPGDALDPSSYVPLEIEGDPVAARDGNGHTVLGVSLRREHVERLRDFTRAHLGGRVAIVLGGEIVTVHKV